MSSLRHIPDAQGNHHFLREDGSTVIKIYLPPKLTKAERIEAVERLIALAIAFAVAT